MSFPREVSDNPTTTGNGTFDLRTLEQSTAEYTYPYDTPPHNRQYFQWHLESLAHYYDRVSESQIHITFDVFPEESDSSYVLPWPMVEYGRERTREGLNRKLCELFRDGIRLADSREDTLDFEAYDCVVLFHAGVGRETGEPNDIPSAYLYPEDLETYLGGLVSVNGGQYQVKEGIILPEAVSLIGTGGLNGSLAKFFGYQLGLPGFSNFQDGLPGAGGWSLMDTGDANYGAGTRGFVPCHPMIWSKMELGWVTPVVVTRDTTLQIAASDLQGTTLPKALQIPISGDEHYLLENRQARHGGEAFPEAQFSIGDSAGVCLSVEHYDAFVPGSGILIWHVNDRIIQEKRATGAVNNDFVRRGLYLEEADGYQDIGNKYVSYGRADQINGSETDPFYVGGVTTFSQSKSDLGADTGIAIEVKSPRQDTMTVQISFRLNEPGWPLRTDASFTENSPTLSPDGLRIFAVSDDERLFVWDRNGSVADTSGAGQMALRDGSVRTAYGDLDLDGQQDSVSVKGDTLWINNRAVLLGEEIHTSPVLGDIDHNGYLEAVFCATGEVDAYAFNGVPASGFPVLLPAKDHIGRISSTPILADLDVDGTLEIVFGTVKNGIFAVDGRGEAVGGFPLPTIGAVKTSPLFSDLDDDGRLELTALTDSGYVHRWGLQKLSPSFTAGMEGVVWGEFGQNPENTCAFPDSLLAESPTGPHDRVLYEDRAYCYPNPVHGGQARLRFYLGRQVPVHIKVFNGAGELVDQFSKEDTEPQIENEVSWETRGHASGLYLCRIEAADEVIWVKMAISR